MRLSTSFTTVISITAVFILLFCIANFTSFLHPKPRYNAKQSDYTLLQDVWKTSEGNKKLAIFLHGMYSNPKTFETLADLMVKSGWDVYMPALPAGAANLAQMKQVGPWSWSESLHFARQKVLAQQSKYDEIVLGGHSQGGALTLALAPELDFVSGFVVIAGPVRLYSKNLSLSDNIGIFFSGILTVIMPKGIRFPVDEREGRKQVERIEEMSQWMFPETIFSMKQGLKNVRKNLPKITKPLFLAYEKGDQTVGFESFNYIVDKVGSENISELVFQVPKDQEPYGHRHDLLWYAPIKDDLNAAILLFLNKL